MRTGTPSDTSIHSVPLLIEWDDPFVHNYVPTRLATSKSWQLETPGNWRDQDLDVMNYADDFIGCEKLSVHSAQRIFTTGKTVSLLHMNANASETVSKNASGIGMSVNQAKTQMICISASRDSDTSSYIKVG